MSSSVSLFTRTVAQQLVSKPSITSHPSSFTVHLQDHFQVGTSLHLLKDLKVLGTIVNIRFSFENEPGSTFRLEYSRSVPNQRSSNHKVLCNEPFQPAKIAPLDL
jgi:hypothetical protein